jgi:hypothetical protein
MAVVGAATVFFDCVFLYDWATVRFRRPTKKAASLSRGDESDLLTGFLFGDVALHRCTQPNVGNRNCWFSIFRSALSLEPAAEVAEFARSGWLRWKLCYSPAVRSRRASSKEIACRAAKRTACSKSVFSPRTLIKERISRGE